MGVLFLLRVLRNGGVFMLVTYGSPNCRLSRLLLPGLEWSLEVYCLTKVDDDYSGPGLVSSQPPVVKGPYTPGDEVSRGQC
jgi:hypothetical protein